MSALTVDRTPTREGEWDDVVRLWEETDWPEGCKVEIIEGTITVTPPPVVAHALIVEKVHRRLYSVLAEEWGVHQTLGAAAPARGALFVPDLMVMDGTVAAGSGRAVPLAAAELVVEVTSRSNATHDRITKAAVYARTGVPLYLLIDRFAPGGPTVTLYGEPQGEVYRTLAAVKFGEEIHLPEPFDLTLDTSDFPEK